MAQSLLPIARTHIPARGGGRVLSRRDRTPTQEKKGKKIYSRFGDGGDVKGCSSACRCIGRTNDSEGSWSRQARQGVQREAGSPRGREDPRDSTVVLAMEGR
ncbi:hypothetical protein CHS0354_039363 [Potamilus streckersoni]|uniref:Uncharacterized protein n=1 Tax=Potamilus streckersoni TaxID=2493646 RepID=A0AAE0T351_9BIVA|nr:hypothetical protein CHS0354_039363 [Potamilus streckersoni]